MGLRLGRKNSFGVGDCLDIWNEVGGRNEQCEKRDFLILGWLDGVASHHRRELFWWWGAGMSIMSLLLDMLS